MKFFDKFSCLKDYKIRWFVILIVLFNGMISVLNIFINTYLLKGFGIASKQVMYYNLILIGSQLFAMFIGIFLSRKIGLLPLQRLGFCFYAAALILLAVFGENLISFYYLIAIALSFGAGFFYNTFSFQSIHYLSDDNRDVAEGTQSFFVSLIGLLLPLITGIVIVQFNDYLGYKIMFGIEAVISVCAFLSTFKTPKIKTPDSTPKMFVIAKTVLKNGNGRKIMFSSLFENLRSFSMTFYFSILIYSFILNEFYVSLNSTIGNIMAILSALLYCTLVSAKNRWKSIFISVVICMIATIPLFFVMNTLVLIIYYAIITFMGVFISLPVFNTYLKFSESLESFKSDADVTYIMRELFVATGKIMGVLLIMFIPQTTTGITVVLMIITTSNLLCGFLIKGINFNDQNPLSV